MNEFFLIYLTLYAFLSISLHLKQNTSFFSLFAFIHGVRSTISPIRHRLLSPPPVTCKSRDFTEPGRPRPAKLCQENPQRFRHHRIVPRAQITGNRKDVGSRNPNLYISLCRVTAQSPRKNTPSTAPVHEKNQRRRRQSLEPHRPRTEATTIDRRDTKTLDLS